MFYHNTGYFRSTRCAQDISSIPDEARTKDILPAQYTSSNQVISATQNTMSQAISATQNATRTQAISPAQVIPRIKPFQHGFKFLGSDPKYTV